MVILLNFIFGILAGILADYLLARIGVSGPIKIVIAVIAGILVFLANFAAAVV